MKLNRPTRSKKPVWRRLWFWAAFVLLAAGGGAAWYFFIGNNAAQAQAAGTATEPQTTPVKRGDIRISASGSGTLVAVQSVDLSFSTGGTVVELNVKVGDMVKTGEVLARLGNAEDLEANVASAQLSLLEARQALDELQSNAGVSLAQANQDWLSAQETYNTALETSQRMAANSRCSQEVRTKYSAALEHAKQKLEAIDAADRGNDAWIDAKNDYDTALANYNYCASYTDDEKISARSSLNIAEVNLEQAQDKYTTLKEASGIDPDALALAEAKVTAAEKLLAKAEEDLTGITLAAPMDGKVTYLAAGQGAIVDAAKFVTIADTGHLALDVSVDDTDLEKFVVGNSADVTFDALPDQVFHGIVVQADPELTSSGQYKVVQGVVELDGAANTHLNNLPLGLSASVTILSAEAKDVLLVPASALRDLGNQEYGVMVVSSGGQMRLQTVQVGIQDDTNAEITGGLKEGALVSTGIVQTNSSAANSANRSGDSGFPGGDMPMPPDGGMIPPQ